MKIKYPYGKIYCRILNKTIAIKKDGQPDKNSGWLCDCGNWTNENLRSHDVYWYGNRR